MNKYKLLAMVIAVVLGGLIFLISQGALDASSLQGLKPKVMGIIALPFFIVVFVLAGIWKRNNEDRKWKKALEESRANKASRVKTKNSLQES